MTGIHRERPGAADLSSATGAPAVALGDDIWMSPGVSNAYAVSTDAGRVIVNTGLAFEGPLHRRAFDAAIPGRTATIVVTQGHPDHWGRHRVGQGFRHRDHHALELPLLA